MAFSLTSDDHIYGSHRKPRRKIPRPKGFAAIRQWSDAQLMEPHEDLPRRRAAGPGRKGIPGHGEGPAVRFFVLWSVLRAFCPRNRFQPRPGRLHARLLHPVWNLPQQRHRGRPPAPSLPARRSSSVSTANRAWWCGNIGDASFGCGPVWEGITFSAMDQYRKLWECFARRRPPIIFNCMNNFYGMGGQPFGETMGVQFIARIGAGVTPSRCTPSASTATTAAGHRRLPAQAADP